MYARPPFSAKEPREPTELCRAEPLFPPPRSFILTVKISHSNPTTIQNLAVVLGGSPLNAPLSKLKWEPLPSLIGPFL